jgi:hypothetical protein
VKYDPITFCWFLTSDQTEAAVDDRSQIGQLHKSMAAGVREVSVGSWLEMLPPPNGHTK